MPALRKYARIKGSVVVALACLGAGWVILIYLQRYGLSTLAADRAAVRDWLVGEGLYAYRSPLTGLGTTLPPLAAIVLTPVALLPLPATGCLLAVAGLAALILAVIALVGPVARRYGRPRGRAALIAVLLALLIEPVRAAIGLGSLDLALFGLITADVVALRRGAWARSRAAWWPGPPASRPPRGRMPADLIRRGWATGAWAGVGIGIASTLAVGSTLFLGYLIVSRQWRAALTAIATTATLWAGTLLIAPAATATWLGTVLPHVGRSGPIDAVTNHSLAGVLARLYDAATAPVLIWLSFAGLLLAVGMIRARCAHADGDEIAAFTLIGLTGAAVGLVSPVQELIWVLPAVVILLDAAARERVARRPPRRRLPGARYAAAAVLVYVLFVVDPAWTAGGNGYAVAVIVLLNALPWRPGVAPAILPRPRPRPVRRTPAIPGPRAS